MLLLRGNYHSNICFSHSFHVGSGCQSSSAYVKALVMSEELFQCGKDLGYNFFLLDIGGGFPGTKCSHTLFTDIASSINQHIEQLFSSSKYPNLKIIAEPGKSGVVIVIFVTLLDML